MRSLNHFIRPFISFLFLVTLVRFGFSSEQLRLKAGVGKVDITNKNVPLVNDPLFVKALTISDGEHTYAIITIDAVAIAEIGTIRDPFFQRVRETLQKELGIAPEHVIVNASHCHGVVCDDIEQRTVEAVRIATQKMVDVQVGSGTGHEDHVSENRRMLLKSGKEADVRHAYALPPDEEVLSVGPIDPEIGILRFDRIPETGSTDAKPIAILYNFACHPIQGVPNGGNTADLVGFASKAIEENTGAMAFFIQGCAGDINPIQYKDVDHPRDAEPLGNRLGLSVLRGVHNIETHSKVGFAWLHETMELPRGDLVQRIEDLKAEQTRLLQSLQGTSLNFKTFLPLAVKYGLSEEFPSAPSHRYLHEKLIGRGELERMDQENRKNMEAYIRNVLIMEKLTRVQTNLDLLKMHQAQHSAAAKRTLTVEINAVRIGEFGLITFPGELTVEIGLGIKARSPIDQTFVAGYTNGYIYYAPTAKQLQNLGGAQEDSDCLLAPEWQDQFEERVSELLKKIVQ